MNLKSYDLRKFRRLRHTQTIHLDMRETAHPTNERQSRFIIFLGRLHHHMLMPVIDSVFQTQKWHGGDQRLAGRLVAYQIIASRPLRHFKNAQWIIRFDETDCYTTVGPIITLSAFRHQLHTAQCPSVSIFSIEL